MDEHRSPNAYTEAKSLYDELEAQGCRPWMDEKGLDYGDVLAKEIFQAIEQCDFIIPIMTGGYATSLWCLRELYYAALQRDPKRPKTIIPMLLEDEDVIDDQKAGKWLLSIGTEQKYFRKEEKDAVVQSLKEKVFSVLSIHDQEIIDPGRGYHKEGFFCSVINFIKGTDSSKPLILWSWLPPYPITCSWWFGETIQELVVVIS